MVDRRQPIDLTPNSPMIGKRCGGTKSRREEKSEALQGPQNEQPQMLGPQDSEREGSGQREGWASTSRPLSRHAFAGAGGDRTTVIKAETVKEIPEVQFT